MFFRVIFSVIFGDLLVETGKKIVVPGDLVFNEPRRVPGCFVEGGKTFASTIGLLQEDKIVPLKGFYIPRYGDFVVGVVKEERFSGYTVDLNSPYEGQLSAKELRERFELGDVIAAEIIDVNEVHEAILGNARKLSGGELIEISAVKVPRVIGKNASMLSVIQQYSRSDILVGKNGRIYLRGGDAALATLAIFKVCREAHLSGLTERIVTFLQKESKANSRQV